MDLNHWTLVLVTTGVVSLASVASADEPMSMSAVRTALSATTLSGYVDTAATWRPGTDRAPNGNVNVPAYSFPKTDGFSLNVVDLSLDKPMDESPWAAGYHFELMLGPDAVGSDLGGAFGSPSGSARQFVPASNLFGSATAIREAYVSLRTPIGNGITWKVGIWDSIIGYESSSAPLDPNYTRSYGYTIEPTTHTGILATYQVNDVVTVRAGIADDSNVGEGTVGVNPYLFESQKAYMGDLQITAPASAGWFSGATLNLGVVDVAGNNSALGGSPNSFGSTSWYAGVRLPTPIAALKLGATFDYLDLHNAHPVAVHVPANPSDDSVWNIALYSSYQASERLSLNLRGEYLANEGAVSSLSSSGADANFSVAEEVTATLQYQMWANVISRLEFRWDHVEHGNAYGANQSTGNPNRANDFLLALNLIYQF